MKKLTKVLLLCLMLSLVITASAFAVSAALTEDEVNTFLIYDADDLVEFASLVNSNRSMNVKLMADIDMTGVTYTVPTAGYYGVFDGNGHTISNMHRTVSNVTAEGEYGILFNKLGNGYDKGIFGKVMNLTMKDCSITLTGTAKVGLGAIAGKCDRNDIIDITFKNVDITMTAGTNSRAGLAAGLSCWQSSRADGASTNYFNLTADKDCSIVSDSSTVYLGSFVGSHTNEPIYFHNCYTEATVSAANGYAGGIIGWLYTERYPKFYGMTVKGTVSGKNAGALAGCNNTNQIYGLIELTNTTGLELYGYKGDKTYSAEYYDDVAKYGKMPVVDDGVYLITSAEELYWYVKF